MVYRYGFVFGPIAFCLAFFLFCLVLSMAETQSYAWVPSLVVDVFAAGPIMFPMGAVALGSVCWPEVVLWTGSSGGTLSKINMVPCVCGDVCTQRV